ncbi:MAG: nucleoside triphosphate pyrophosphohydrolase [Chthoniobacteraceae bacterium]
MNPAPDHPDPIVRLIQIVARLRAPDGCPWDIEQTHESLCPHLLEEAYEVIDAIEQKDDANFREELGDFLLQVVLHSQIASETGRFDLNQVAEGICEKLVRRHPHVFGEGKLDDSGAVLKQWEVIKRAEKGDKQTSLLDGVARALPALMRAEKIQKKAARVGFDWPDAKGALEKLSEEIAELRAAFESGHAGHVEEELGDLLFSVVNVSRKLSCEAELALSRATDKFSRRFQKVEAVLAEQGKTPADSTLEEMDAIWNRVKTEV